MNIICKTLIDKGFPIFFTILETLEMLKYSSNTYLKIKIRFLIKYEICDIYEKNLS